MEILRRAIRPFLGRSRLYTMGSRASDFVAVLRHDGLATWRALQRLRSGGTLGRPASVELYNLRHPFMVRPGGEDAATVIQTVVREEWGQFSPATAPLWMIDAGAYIGDTTAYFLSRFPALNAIALEPNRASYEAAAKNLNPYGERAILLQAALMPTDGSAFLSGESTVASIATSGSEVQTLCIPTLLQRFGIAQLDILKMDIEGAELPIFAQDPDSWLPRVTMLLIEIHSDAALSAIQAALRRHAFEMRRFRSVWYCERPGMSNAKARR